MTFQNFTLAAVLCLSSAYAIAKPMTIQGQTVDVTVEAYRGGPGGMVAHAVRLDSPQVFDFKGGLRLELSGRLLLHDNRNIWMAQGTESKSPVTVTVGDQRVSLNCSARPTVNGVAPATRIVQFHPDGGYRLGCDVFGEAALSTPAADVTIAGGSSIDLTAEGHLGYAARINAGQLKYADQVVDLKPGSEISLHDRHHAEFFTLAEGRTLRVSLPSGDTVKVSGGAMNASISLDTRGRLAKGVLAEPYKVPRLNYELAPGTGVIFEENKMDKLSPPYLSTVMLNEPVVLKVAGVLVKAAVIELSLFETVTSVTVAEAFEFRPPEDPNRTLAIPAGAKITMANTRRIHKIEVPQAR